MGAGMGAGGATRVRRTSRGAGVAAPGAPRRAPRAVPAGARDLQPGSPGGRALRAPAGSQFASERAGLCGQPDTQHS